MTGPQNPATVTVSDWGVALLVHLNSVFLPRKPDRFDRASIPLLEINSSAFEENTRPEFCEVVNGYGLSKSLSHLIRTRLVDLPCFQFSHLVNNADHHGSLHEALQ